ncbi:taurine catabolism dioxygenase [Ophiostoma piceae UAMH 11346]|uniref:Taurine catabolism dioxygenase n=1 Tax=Ophiostoma piceae (strain UAMH 11346) TaxID=1262450 RepID=S3CL05_OPHP1|nr:taurine catabolism dioxygenase [Ophiostoma piceae UAMH 11346]
MSVPKPVEDNATGGPLVVGFKPFEVPGQHLVHGNIFPLALKLVDEDPSVPLGDVIEKIKQLAKDGTIRHLLNKHGVLYFRGLPLKTREELSVFVEAFGFKNEHQEIGLSGIRSQVSKHIKTASELPGTVSMFFHNEYARTNHFPEIVFFYSERVPEQGGQTPLASSLELYDSVKAEFPELVDKLLELGVIGRQYYPSKDDPDAKAIGWNWQDSYGFDIKEGDSLEVQHEKVEKLLREEVKAEAEWQPNGSLHVVQRVPAIRKIKSSGLYSFFNTLSGVYGVAKRLGALEYPYKEKNGPGYKLPSSFGDGSPIPEKYLERIIEIQDSIGFLVPWKEGDIAVVNNYTVQHSRTKFVGERSVLVSLWDDIDDFDRTA